MEDEAPQESIVPAKPTERGLTDDLRNEITHFINQKAVSPTDACPVCGHHFNLVGEDSYQVQVRMEPDTVFSTSFMPLFTTVCFNCGFVRFFSENIVREKMSEAQGELPLAEPESSDGS
jgi:hypothetical protein